MPVRLAPPLNQEVAAKIEQGELVMPAGVPQNYGDAQQLMTQNGIRLATTD